MERNDIAPVPAERLRLCRDRGEVPAHALAVTTVAGRPDEHGGIVEQRNECLRIAAVDRRLKRGENGVRGGEGVRGHLGRTGGRPPLLQAVDILIWAARSAPASARPPGERPGG